MGTKDGKFGGSLLFEDKDHPIDPDWIRAVCQSFTFSGDGFPDRFTEDEVIEEFRRFPE